MREGRLARPHAHDLTHTTSRTRPRAHARTRPHRILKGQKYLDIGRDGSEQMVYDYAILDSTVKFHKIKVAIFACFVEANLLLGA